MHIQFVGINCALVVAQIRQKVTHSLLFRSSCQKTSWNPNISFSSQKSRIEVSLQIQHIHDIFVEIPLNHGHSWIWFFSFWRHVVLQLCVNNDFGVAIVFSCGLDCIRQYGRIRERCVFNPLARNSLNVDIDNAFCGENDQIASPLEGHFDILIGLQDAGGGTVHLFDLRHVQGPIVRATNQRGTRIDVALVLTNSRNFVTRRSPSKEFVGKGHVQLVHVGLALAKVAAELLASPDTGVEDEITISVPFSGCFYRKGLDVIPFHGKELDSLTGQTFHVDQKESCRSDDH
mmetsp:Transcript_13469/g.33888  ORF Transcript_13469/g.33888 Transcript_13469/m.33888 type:complete len:289 (-) Transcript_13469:730-1596(-)